MPELPEVETIRLYLHKKIVGKKIEAIEVLNTKSFIGNTKDVIGKTITDTYRKGKVLNISLNDGTYLNVHLKMSGQLLYSLSRETAVFNVKIPLAETNTMPARTTRVILDFADGSSLFFNDMRKFGWVMHSINPQGTNAPDVTRKEFTLEYFSSIVKTSKKNIKALLLDQDKIAGVGNIYANDSLFIAKILPSRIANTLSDREIKLLHQSVKKIIQEGLEYRGTSATEVYVAPDGKKGSYQDHFKVYSRENQPCSVCGTLIQREKQNGRSSFFCPHCQH